MRIWHLDKSFHLVTMNMSVSALIIVWYSSCTLTFDPLHGKLSLVTTRFTRRGRASLVMVLSLGHCFVVGWMKRKKGHTITLPLWMLFGLNSWRGNRLRDSTFWTSTSHV